MYLSYGNVLKDWRVTCIAPFMKGREIEVTTQAIRIPEKMNAIS